jgi:hypothetical protein
MRPVDTRLGLATSALAIAAIVAVYAWRTRVPGWRPSSGLRLIAVLSIGSVATVGVVVLPAHTDHRYPITLDVHDARIGVVGTVVQYPLYGEGVSNHVQYVGRIEDGRYRPVTTCRTWAAAVNDGGYSHIVIAALALEANGGPYDWTRADPAATLVRGFTSPSAGAYDVAVFEIDGELDPSRC